MRWLWLGLLLLVTYKVAQAQELVCQRIGYVEKGAPASCTGTLVPDFVWLEATKLKLTHDALIQAERERAEALVKVSQDTCLKEVGIVQDACRKEREVLLDAPFYERGWFVIGSAVVGTSLGIIGVQCLSGKCPWR